MLENFPTSEWPFWGGGWGLKKKRPLAVLRDRGGNGRCPLTEKADKRSSDLTMKLMETLAKLVQK